MQNSTQNLIKHIFNTSDHILMRKKVSEPLQTIGISKMLQVYYINILHYITINFSELHHEKLCEKNLLVPHEGPQWFGLRDRIF